METVVGTRRAGRGRPAWVRPARGALRAARCSMFADVQHLHHLTQVAAAAASPVTLPRSFRAAARPRSCPCLLLLPRAPLPQPTARHRTDVTLPVRPLALPLLCLLSRPGCYTTHLARRARSWASSTGLRTCTRHRAARQPAGQTCYHPPAPLGTCRRTTRVRARSSPALTLRASTTRTSGRARQRTRLASGKRHEC